MHVPDEAQILLIPARLANSAAPFFYSFENLHLHPAEADRRALGEATDELVEELFGADLQLEGVATVLNTDVQQVQGEQGDVGVAVVDVVNDSHGGLAWGAALFGIDQVGDLEIQGQVGLVVLGAAGRLNEALELGRSVAAPSSPWVAGGRPCAGRLHRDGRLRVKVELLLSWPVLSLGRNGGSFVKPVWAGWMSGSPRPEPCLDLLWPIIDRSSSRDSRDWVCMIRVDGGLC